MARSTAATPGMVLWYGSWRGKVVLRQALGPALGIVIAGVLSLAFMDCAGMVTPS